MELRDNATAFSSTTKTSHLAHTVTRHVVGDQPSGVRRGIATRQKQMFDDR